MRVTEHPIEPDELMAYLDGELPVDRAAFAQSHLDHCDECQKVADDFRSVSARLTAWRVEPSRMRAPVLPEKPKEAPRFRHWRWASSALVVSPLLAVTIVMAIFVRVPGRQYQKLQPVVVDDVRSMNPMIVRTSQLTVTVKAVDKAQSSLEEVVKRHGGYVGQLTVQARTLDATLRVPTDHLAALMAELKQLGHVESESQTGEEVTQQYVDLEARLTNARNSEQRLTELLRQRTGKLSDVLAVEKEMERVRGEIERMEAERKNLANRVTFATVNLKLAEENRAELPGFRNAAVGGYRTLIKSMTGGAIFLLYNGPVALFWGAVLFFPCRWLWRRSRRRLLHSL